MSSPTKNSTAQRLPRLLALVPYLLSRPGIPIAEAAGDFGVTATQLRRDLELLWVCGLPGYGPGDLIDLSFDEDSVTVTYDAGMRRPLRLTAGEATSLLVALRALADTPGVTDGEAVRRALAKIESAVGDAQPAGLVVGLSGHGTGENPTHVAAVRTATSTRRALRIRYYTASRDRISDRTVDPMRVLLADGRSYLEAWCRRAGGMRLFRLDRIDDAEVLEEPAVPPEHARPTDVSTGLFQPAPDQHSAELLLDADGRWVAEYYAIDEITELDDGKLRVRMRYSDEAWMVRLLLGLGGRARVVQPRSLAQRLQRSAVEALERARNLSDN